MFDCVICMGKINLVENTTIAATSCRDASHLFHRDCIVEWLRKSNTCPTCRSNITVDSLKRFSPDLNKDLAYSGWSKKTVDVLEKVESNDEDTRKVMLGRIKELERETRALASEKSALLKKNKKLDAKNSKLVKERRKRLKKTNAVANKNDEEVEALNLEIKKILKEKRKWLREKIAMKKNLNVAKTLANAYVKEAKRWQERHDELQAANDERNLEGLSKKKRRKLSKNAGKRGDGASEKILIAGGMRGAWSSDQSSLKHKSNNVMSYDLSSGKWETCAELKTTESDHQTVKIGGKLVTVVSDHKKIMYNYMEVKLLTENPSQLKVQQAQTSAEMRRKRGGFAVCSFHDCILVSGGVDVTWPIKPTRSCELFTFESNTWIEVARMNFFRSSHAMVYLGGKAWAIGGNEKDKSNSIELFDPIANKWDVSEVRMVNERRGHRAVFHGGKIFVVGGIDENDETLDTVEVYSSNQFNLITPKLKLGRSYFGLCVYKKYLVVCGGIVDDRGYKQNKITDEVECLNLETLKFRKFPGLFKKLPCEIESFGMCCISY